MFRTIVTTSLELSAISSKPRRLYSILHIPIIASIFSTIPLLFTSTISLYLFGSRTYLFLCLPNPFCLIPSLFSRPISSGKLFICSNFLLLSLSNGLEDNSFFLFSLSPLQQISTISLPLLSPVSAPFPPPLSTLVNRFSQSSAPSRLLLARIRSSPSSPNQLHRRGRSPRHFLLLVQRRRRLSQPHPLRRSRRRLLLAFSPDLSVGSALLARLRVGIFAAHRFERRAFRGAARCYRPALHSRLLQLAATPAFGSLRVSPRKEPARSELGGPNRVRKPKTLLRNGGERNDRNGSLPRRLERHTVRSASCGFVHLEHGFRRIHAAGISLARSHVSGSSSHRRVAQFFWLFWGLKVTSSSQRERRRASFARQFSLLQASLLQPSAMDRSDLSDLRFDLRGFAVAGEFGAVRSHRRRCVRRTGLAVASSVVRSYRNASPARSRNADASDPC